MSLPPPKPGQTYVTVSAIQAGQITAPVWSFMETEDRDAKMVLPCLAFLITHPHARLSDAEQPASSTEPKPARILFDLGLREGPQDYTPGQQAHLQHRHPVTFGPSVAKTLAAVGLTSSDVGTVIFSHVHWDHTGDPRDFGKATFVIGHGSSALLEQGEIPGAGSHACFDRTLLANHKVVELPPLDITNESHVDRHSSGGMEGVAPRPLGPFPAALDIFQDGSVYVIPSPGHLAGHVNLLCRTGDKRWVYLGGDTYHDVRLLTGEKKIATWTDDHGHHLCVHTDREAAEAMFTKLRALQAGAKQDGAEVEIIVSHDARWCEGNQHRLFPVNL
ncbi:MAG: hypothetical protein M1818_006361 [Claussenomyces sp. TS43310]|nr:MAG: hypothetical protein M1818_006361 [Claussenomyces sp. TS43310]